MITEFDAGLTTPRKIESYLWKKYGQTAQCYLHVVFIVVDRQAVFTLQGVTTNSELFLFWGGGGLNPFDVLAHMTNQIESSHAKR